MFSTYWGRISKESTTLQAKEHPTQQRSRVNARGEQNATWNHQLKSKTARSWGCGFREESWLALMRSWVPPPALQKKKINTGDQGTLVILKYNTVFILRSRTRVRDSLIQNPKRQKCQCGDPSILYSHPFPFLLVPSKIPLYKASEVGFLFIFWWPSHHQWEMSQWFLLRERIN